MGSINGIKGLSFASGGTSSLIAAFGSDMINVATGLGYGLNLTVDKQVEMEAFLQHLFFQNFTDTPLTFNGTTWGRTNVGKVPLSKYIKLWNGQLYLGYVNLNGTEYPSRVWHSDAPRNDRITWGYEAGSNLKTFANNTLVASANAGFLAHNIKRGDPFFITSGNAAGEYRVGSISADQQIQLTNIHPWLAPAFTTTGASYWTGGNWFDTDRDDGDFLTGLAANPYHLVIFKRDSLHRYNGSSKVKVRGAPGTTSSRSIVELKELIIYFYGASGTQTGFYAYDGRESQNISAPIQDYVDGIASGKYTTIAAWAEGDLYRAFVGTITNTNKNLSIPEAVLTWDYNTRTWSVDPIADTIVAGTEFRQSGVKQTYLATDEDKILITPSGNDFNGEPVPWQFSTQKVYPAGTTAMNTFTRIQIISESANGVQVKYKLHLTPFDSDKDFQGLGNLTNEKTELILPEEHNQASGIELQFVGSDETAKTPEIKKVTIFYRNEGTIIQ